MSYLISITYLPSSHIYPQLFYRSKEAQLGAIHVAWRSTWEGMLSIMIVCHALLANNSNSLKFFGKVIFQHYFGITLAKNYQKTKKISRLIVLSKLQHWFNNKRLLNSQKNMYMKETHTICVIFAHKFWGRNKQMRKIRIPINQVLKNNKWTKIIVLMAPILKRESRV